MIPTYDATPRGHAGIMTDRVPQVRLATEPDRLELLVGYAERAECGLETDGDGLVTVYAPTVLSLHKLARFDDRRQGCVRGDGEPTVAGAGT